MGVFRVALCLPPGALRLSSPDLRASSGSPGMPCDGGAAGICPRTDTNSTNRRARHPRPLRSPPRTREPRCFRGTVDPCEGTRNVFGAGDVPYFRVSPIGVHSKRARQIKKSLVSLIFLAHDAKAELVRAVLFRRGYRHGRVRPVTQTIQGRTARRRVMAARTVPVARVNMIFWVLSGASTSASLGGRQAENG